MRLSCYGALSVSTEGGVDCSVVDAVANDDDTPLPGSGDNGTADEGADTHSKAKHPYLKLTITPERVCTWNNPTGGREERKKQGNKHKTHICLMFLAQSHTMQQETLILYSNILTLKQ